MPPRRADIQGLRALAVGLVVMYHAGFRVFQGGFVGVDVFFVISGFLITGQLLKPVLAGGRIDFASFYARRARRILPASFAVLLATIVAAWLFVPPLQLQAVLRGALATALYVPNYLFASDGTNYLLATTAPSLFLHYWSLGVEEQFYLFWPALLALAFFLARRSLRTVAAVMAGTAALSFALSVVTTPASPSWAFFGLHTRWWEFAVGGLAAVAVVRMPGLLPRPIARRAAGLAGWAGGAVLIGLLLVFDAHTVFPGAAAAVPVLATAAVLLGCTWGGAWSPAWLLGLRPFVFLGETSYSLYLVHWPLFMIPAAYVGATGGSLSGPVRLALVVLAVPVAWALFRWVERPLRDSGWARGIRPRGVLITAGALSLALGVGSSITGAGLEAQQWSASRPASAFALGSDPVGTAYVPQNMTPTLNSIAALRSGTARYCKNLEQQDFVWRCDFGSNASAPLVVFFGDSHADQFRFALLGLADEGRIRLETYMMEGCPAARVSTEHDGQPWQACDDWRRSAIASLRARHPAVVLAGSYRDDHDAADLAGWRAGEEWTLEQLSVFTRVAMMVDTPSPTFDVPTCLSAHLDDAGACSVTLDTRFQAAQLDAARAAGVPAIDVNSELCDGSVCPAVLGNLLGYRDGSHISYELSAALAPVIVPVVERLLGTAAQ